MRNNASAVGKGIIQIIHKFMFYTDSNCDFAKQTLNTISRRTSPRGDFEKRFVSGSFRFSRRPPCCAQIFEFSLVLRQSKKTQGTRRGLARECNQLCEGAALSSREDQQLLLLCCLCAAEQPKCEQHQPWQSRVFTCCKFFWPLLLLLLFAPLPCPSAPPARD